MIREQAPDERIREWLHDEAAGQLPDWVLTTTFERTRAQRQLRSLPGWRFPTLSNPVRIILVVGATLAALLGISYSGGQTPTQAPHRTCPAPVPATSPAAVSSAATSDSPVEFLWSAAGPADDPLLFTSRAFALGGRVAIDSTCRIWVADAFHNRFAQFKPDGSFITYWGSGGNGDGQFLLEAPRTSDAWGGAAFAPDGSFYVMDPGNYRIQHFDRDGNFLGKWGGMGGSPGHFLALTALTVDASGVVHVLDSDRDVVERYDSTGVLLGGFSPHVSMSGADDLKVDSRGHVYVTASFTSPNQILEFDPNGTPVGTIPRGPAVADASNQFNGMDVDAMGRVFVARGPAMIDRAKVEVYDPQGTRISAFGALQLGYGFSEGLALDGVGGLYVTDGAGNRLVKFRLLPPLAP